MKYFGTDGIRGCYQKDITLDLVNKACLGLAAQLNQDDYVVVARDPRLSSDDIFDMVYKTLNQNGINVYDLGVVPTPFVSFMVKELKAQAGVMISASHNPYTDNGIKFFDANGVKIPDQMEAEIEKVIDNPISLNREPGTTEFVNCIDTYMQMINNITTDLDQLYVALDCANGASSKIARDVYLSLNAQLTVIGENPDGYNINDNVGALHPQTLSKVVVDNSCDCGFCFDGDCDRIIVIDRLGHILTGDHIIFLLACYLQAKNQLKDNTVVVTSMTNMGVIKALKELGIECVVTDVGDRFVIQKMLESGYNVGGEQSGHIILSDYVTTGDGLLTSVFLASIMSKHKNIFEEVEDYLFIYPQKLINIKVNNKHAIMQDKYLLEQVKLANEKLGDSGRVVIRASGTESLVRIMVEANNQALVDEAINYFEAIINNLKEE